ncbi:hypothetical protein PG994_014109 [Apiospora phragmitis]|uniref:Hydrophobin n=1 Tax=Apiospora phragmitis TaxID=2905665 RepID=A0ABR1T3E2_9PEZI
MQFTTVVVMAFATFAAAAPQKIAARTTSGDKKTTVEQAQTQCGTYMQLSCCNKADYSGDSVNAASGILSGLLGGGALNGLGLFDGCSKLEVTALIGVSDLLNSQCEQTAACCQNSGSEQNGAVNVGLPCVALSSLL